MTEKITTEELEYLRTCVPLKMLSDNKFEELTADIEVSTISRGKFLFHEGDTAQGNFYLCNGVVALLSGKRTVERITTGDEKARFPLANQLPRSYSAKASSSLRYVRIDGRKLSQLLAVDAASQIQVEEAGEDDWMSLLLQVGVMQQIPPANIQRVLALAEKVDVQAGMMIIRQGDPGDYYYMLVTGEAQVSRVESEDKEPLVIAQLSAGDAFGEEALLSDYVRNSSVSMKTSGTLIRLKKDDFLQLIHQPLLKSYTFDQAQEQVAKGAVWLDVRSSASYEEFHLPGSINIPAASLRRQIAELAPNYQYIICSSNGRTAISAAFLLTERGFDVSILADGFSRFSESEQEALTSSDMSGEDAAANKSRLEARVHDAERQANELAEQLVKIEAEKQQVETERRKNLANLKESVERARQRMQVFEKEKAEALKDKDTARAELSKVADNLKKVEDEKRLLAERITDIDGIEEKLSVVLAEREKERAAAQDEANILHKQVAEACDENDELRNELAELRQHVHDADPTITFLEKQLAEKTGLIATYEEQKVGFENKLAALDASDATDNKVDEEKGRESEQQILSLEKENADLARQADDLRAVVERYVEQIREAQVAEEKVASVQDEISLIKQQSEQEISELREKLAQVENTLDSPDDQNSLEREALRQDYSNLQAMLEERQKELKQSDESRQLIEDELEDAHKEIDELRRKLDDIVVSAEESDYMRKEAEEARKHVESALYQIQEDVEEQKTEELRDDRFSRAGRPLDIERVTGGARASTLLMGMMIGIAMFIGGVELLLFLLGKPEFFSLILSESLTVK